MQPASFANFLLIVHTRIVLGINLGTPNIEAYIVPGVPSAYQASSRFQNNYLAGVTAANERQSAEDRSHTSSSLEAAATSELMATRQKFLTNEAATLELSRARKIEVLNTQASEVLQSTQHILQMIPEVTKRAVDRAIKDVEHEALKQLNVEVAQTVASTSGSEAMAKHMAADAAQTAALPYQQGKLQAQQTMVGYVEKSQELAIAVSELKKRAVEIAAASVPLQRAGDVVPAQHLQMEARDVMDKAQQMEAQVKVLSDTALQIQRGLQAYDNAAQAAASYAAYQANPAGLDGASSLPHPPFPLDLPAQEPGPGAPAPAPAPMSSVMASPAASAAG